jgi:hypothetical protein
MARYRRVNPCLWIDEDMAKLSDKVRLLWVYLLTNTAIKSSPGLYRLTLDQVQGDLNWSRKKVIAVLNCLQTAGFLFYSRRKHYVFLPKWAKHELPSNRKACLGWIENAKEVPDSEHKTSYIQELEKRLSGYGIETGNVYGIPSDQVQVQVQVQEQVQDQRPDQFSSSPPPRNTPSKPTTIPQNGEQDFMDLRAYADKLHGRETRGLPRHDEHFYRILSALAEYKLDGCKRIVRGHKRENQTAKFSGIRFAFPQVKGDPSALDMDWIAVYHAAGGKKKSGPVGTNLGSRCDETPRQRFDREEAELKAKRDAMTPEEVAEQEELAANGKRILAEMRGKK